jgi:hypothetical protein
VSTFPRIWRTSAIHWSLVTGNAPAFLRPFVDITERKAGGRGGAGREMVCRAMRLVIFIIIFIFCRIEITNQNTGNARHVPGRKESIKILAIEDDPTHLKLAILVLSAAGHKVSDAKAAEQASTRSNKTNQILSYSIWPCPASGD